MCLRNYSRPVALVLAGLLTVPVFAQQAQKAAETLSVNVNEVSVLATVRDKHGKIVPNLTSSDFALTEDGRKQIIRHFSLSSDQPLTLGLLVDTSRSQRDTMSQERTASETFLQHSVREDKDKAFILHFDHEVELLQDLTPSHQKLQSAAEQLQVSNEERPRMKRNGGSGDGSDTNDSPSPRDDQDGSRQRGARRAGTLLYDAVFLGSDELMKKQHGRKAMIILSDGVDRGSKTTLTEAIESAQRSDTIVYCLYFKGEEDNQNRGFGFPGGRGGGGVGYPGGGYPGGGGRRGGGQGGPQGRQEPYADGKKILQQIAEQTGGRMFEVSKKETPEAIFNVIAEELRNQYDIAYTPDKHEPGYHKIQLTSTKKDYKVQAREGYYAAQ